MAEPPDHAAEDLPPLRSLRVEDGTRLAYRLGGPPDGPTVVLLDGLSCDGFVWRYLRGWLQRRFRVLHLHWRGHGESGLPRDHATVTLPWLADDLDTVVSKLELGPAVLVGHSMGVQVALETAWRRPERVRAAALICGSSGRLLDTFKDTDFGMRVLPALRRLIERHREGVARVMRAVMPTELSFLIARYTEVNPELIRREDFMPYLEHFATMPPDVFARMLHDAAERTARHFLARLTMPALVLAGDRDGFTPPHVSRDLAGALPGGEFALLPEGSHGTPIELPEQTEAALDDFLRRHRLDEPVGSERVSAARSVSLTRRWLDGPRDATPRPGERRDAVALSYSSS